MYKRLTRRPYIYLLGDPGVTANIYCKSRNLPNTDIQNYSTVLLMHSVAVKPLFDQLYRFSLNLLLNSSKVQIVENKNKLTIAAK